MAGGGAVWLAGPLGWDAALIELAVLLVLIGVLSLRAPRRASGTRAENWRELVRGLGGWFVEPRRDEAAEVEPSAAAG